MQHLTLSDEYKMSCIELFGIPSACSPTTNHCSRVRLPWYSPGQWEDYCLHKHVQWQTCCSDVVEGAVPMPRSCQSETSFCDRQPPRLAPSTAPRWKRERRELVAHRAVVHRFECRCCCCCCLPSSSWSLRLFPAGTSLSRKDLSRGVVATRRTTTKSNWKARERMKNRPWCRRRARDDSLSEH